MKFRRLPLGTPIVPPEERTIARSSGLAAHGKASLPCSLAMLSSRTEAPATLTPTDAILQRCPPGQAPSSAGIPPGDQVPFAPQVLRVARKWPEAVSTPPRKQSDLQHTGRRWR